MGGIIKFPISKHNDGYHCHLCMCPVEYYQKPKSYKGDDSCELYSDYMDIRWDFFEKTQDINKDAYIRRCVELLSNDWSKIHNLEEVVNDFVDIDIELGICDFIPVTQTLRLAQA